MKKLFFTASFIGLCGGCLLTLNSCDLLPANKEKKEKARIEQMRTEYNRKIAERDRKWLDQNEATARNFAKDFARDKGYTIQSMTLETREASDVGASGMRFVEYDKPIPTEIQSACYNYNIVTGDISDNGGLIHILVRVKYTQYESPHWTVDSFQAFRN